MPVAQIMPPIKEPIPLSGVTSFKVDPNLVERCIYLKTTKVVPMHAMVVIFITAGLLAIIAAGDSVLSPQPTSSVAAARSNIITTISVVTTTTISETTTTTISPTTTATISQTTTTTIYSPVTTTVTSTLPRKECVWPTCCVRVYPTASSYICDCVG